MVRWWGAGSLWPKSLRLRERLSVCVCWMNVCDYGGLACLLPYIQNAGVLEESRRSMRRRSSGSCVSLGSMSLLLSLLQRRCCFCSPSVVFPSFLTSPTSLLPSRPPPPPPSLLFPSVSQSFSSENDDARPTYGVCNPSMGAVVSEIQGRGGGGGRRRGEYPQVKNRFDSSFSLDDFTFSVFWKSFSSSTKPSPPSSASSAAAAAAVVTENAENLTPVQKISWEMGPSEQPIPVAGRGAGEESERRKPLDLWPGMYHSPVTAALWQARSNITERDGKHGPPQSKLVKRTPEQSRTRVLYSFSSDPILREQYRNPWNGCRIGKLLEDLDALAGTIAMKHCADDDHTTRPLLLVTASVDKISLKKPLHLDKDLQMKGAVAWVGRSSMEIRMEVIQPVQANTHKPLKDDIAMIANFKFVARDSETKKAALVNQLVPESEEEKQLYQEAEARDEYRKQHRKQHEDILGNQNAEYDQEKLKELLLEGRILCDMPALADHNTILIRDTKLENAIICQPQQRNMHGRIFGGFLMRRAYELAFSTCYVFGGIRPLFLEVDHVDFRKPVDVGNLLRFKACVLYTEVERANRPLIHIEVVAYVTQPEVRSSEVSNTFHFTFSLDPNFLKTSTISAVRRVLPASEEEARACLARYDADHLGKYPFLPK